MGRRMHWSIILEEESDKETFFFLSGVSTETTTMVPWSSSLVLVFVVPTCLILSFQNTCTETFSSHRRYVSSALVAEALAVKAAITAAVSSHASSFNVFSDSKALILLLNSQNQDVVLKGILHDIRIMALPLHLSRFSLFRV